MPAISAVEPGFHRIPLPAVLTDSTHGEMTAFELVICRVRDAGGAESTGDTVTVGRNGGTAMDTLSREITELAMGHDADRIEWLWNHIWWATPYGGRGGPTVLALAAFDTATWDLEARRAGLDQVGFEQPRR